MAKLEFHYVTKDGESCIEAVCKNKILVEGNAIHTKELLDYLEAGGEWNPANIN
jgi:hypothetical protein